MYKVTLFLCLFTAAYVSAVQKVYPVPYSSKAIVIDRCTCYEKGNYYSPVSSNDCRSFTQRTAYLPPVEQKCPAGTQFDVNTCVCNHEANTYCPSGCPYNGYVNPGTTGRYCTEKGNIYRQLPGTNCYKFTQETATLPPQVHNCPYGLQFDLRTCVCNYPEKTTCYN